MINDSSLAFLIMTKELGSSRIAMNTRTPSLYLWAVFKMEANLTKQKSQVVSILDLY